MASLDIPFVKLADFRMWGYKRNADMNDNLAKKPGSESIDVAYVAHLARIALTSAEQEMFQAQLEHILEHVAKLNELDVSGVEPMAHAIPVKNRFREDIPAPGLDHDVAMANAPEVRQDQFFVPRILE